MAAGRPKGVKMFENIAEIRFAMQQYELETGYKPNWLCVGFSTHQRLLRNLTSNDVCCVVDGKISTINGVFTIVLSYLDEFAEFGFNPMIYERCEVA